MNFELSGRGERLIQMKDNVKYAIGCSYESVVIEDFDHHVGRIGLYFVRIAVYLNCVEYESLIPRWRQSLLHYLGLHALRHKYDLGERIWQITRSRSKHMR